MTKKTETGDKTDDKEESEEDEEDDDEEEEDEEEEDAVEGDENENDEKRDSVLQCFGCAREGMARGRRPSARAHSQRGTTGVTLL